MDKQYVIGVDYGTDSVRSVLIDTANGQEVSASIYYYPRWKMRQYCNPSLNQFRQHPRDYIEGLEHTISDCIRKSPAGVANKVKAISVDTTGSTPVAVDKNGVPLALLPDFAENPNAMFILWKDHTATKEAAEINEHAKKYNPDYLQYVGGIYSSEWFWAKLLHILREDEAVRNQCYSWVEHCDWVPFLLTGNKDVSTMKRSICAAGHKALWAKEFDGLPSDEFFTSLDPLLQGYTSHLFTETYTSDKIAGTLSEEWAGRLGLPVGVIIGVGAFDAHMGAVGGQIEPFYLSKVMGTSTCDMLVAPADTMNGILVKGICGQVSGSIIPGMVGMEAGQSAFGDMYAWFKNLISWPLEYFLGEQQTKDDISAKLIASLSAEAAKLPLNINDELAVDWLNGRRTPDANQLLKGGIIHLNLATDAPRFFKAIVEATCFGARAIVDRFNEQGVPVKGLIGIGGVANKSPFVMQMMADVINMPIKIHKTEQTCAAGAAMFAATAAGIYNKVEDAMEAMGQGFAVTYFPDESKKEIYDTRYRQYVQLGKFMEESKLQ